MTANTTYVVSYHTDSGFYSGDDSYFATNGRRQWSAARAAGWRRRSERTVSVRRQRVPHRRPTRAKTTGLTWSSRRRSAPDTTPPSVSSVTPANGAPAQSVNTSVTATFSEPMNAATFSSATFELRNPANVLVPATVSVAGADGHPAAKLAAQPLDRLHGAGARRQPPASKTAREMRWPPTSSGRSRPERRRRRRRPAGLADPFSSSRPPRIRSASTTRKCCAPRASMPSASPTSPA